MATVKVLRGKEWREGYLTGKREGFAEGRMLVTTSMQARERTLEEREESAAKLVAEARESGYAAGRAYEFERWTEWMSGCPEAED